MDQSIGVRGRWGGSTPTISADSLTAAWKMPLAISEQRITAAHRVDLHPDLVDVVIVGRGHRRHLDQFARDADVTGLRQLPGPLGERRRAAGERGDLGGHVALAGRQQPSRVAVPPAAVRAPDVAHHELGLVVERTQPRQRQHRRRAPAPCGGRPPCVASAFEQLDHVGDESFERRRPSSPSTCSTRAGLADGQAVGRRRPAAVTGRSCRRSAAAHSAGYRSTFCGLPQLGKFQMRKSPTNKVSRPTHSVQLWSSVSPRSWRRTNCSPPTSTVSSSR